MTSRGHSKATSPPGTFGFFKRLALVAVAVCALGLGADRALAQDVKYTDAQRKALILYNFAKYTEWPKTVFADPDAPFTVGILGKDPFGKDIEILKSKTIKGRNIQVKYFNNTDELTNCHLLFISKSEMENLPQILKRLGNSSILTTAEAQGFIDRDGIINLIPERRPNGTETVGFEVNLLAAEKVNLKLDTQLLRLAKKVKS